jgi:L-threonylcarbamoyladenylate synthase
MDDGPLPIAEAARLLRQGELVAFPTETVYGLGGDATNDMAVARIYAAKGRPRFNPLILHVPDAGAARRLAEFPETARRLADLYWPGPLTLVLRRRPDSRASLLVSAGLDTVALRVPAHPLAQMLLRATGRPIAAPSANRSGRLSPTTAAHVEEELGPAVALVLDGGPCRLGIESTVIDLSGPQPLLLRPGAVSREAIEAVIGPVAIGGRVDDEHAHASPGLSASHYAPSLPVRLDALERRPGESFLAFGPAPDGVGAPDGQLSETRDPVEAAAHLFAMLRALDRPAFTAIAVMPIPEAGIGAAINDRLRRAAAPRP